MGITEQEFWTMNPHRITLHVKAYSKKQRNDIEFSNLIAYIQGQYIVEALLCTVGNMFSDKKSSAFEYPNKPYELGKSKEELTEEELQIQRDVFVARYMTMMHNFNLSKEQKGQEQES